MPAHVNCTTVSRYCLQLLSTSSWRGHPTPVTKCHLHFAVVIVGGGISGASAAHHLASVGIKSLVLEAGKPGYGSDVFAKNASRNPHAEEEPEWRAGIAGTAVPNYPPTAEGKVQNGGVTAKMIVTTFPCRAKEFIELHQEHGAAHFLRLSEIGREMEKELAQQLLPKPAEQLTTLGSLYVAEPRLQKEIEEEYAILKHLGGEVQLLK